jgi:hypothetical protein
MNSSIYSADRATHLRIVAVVMTFSIAIMGIAISLRADAIGSTQATYSSQIGKAQVPGRNVLAAREVTDRI